MNSPANLDDVPEVNIYVDLNGSSELQPPFPASYNNGNGVHHAEASNSRHLQHKFDLNGPAQDVDHGAEVDMDSPVDAAVEEYTGLVRVLKLHKISKFCSRKLHEISKFCSSIG